MATHHVVPQPLGQLLVPLDGEVETVVSEEGHVDLSVLLGEKKKKKANASHTDSSPETSAALLLSWLPASAARAGLPAGGEGRRAPERAGEPRRSCP